MPGTEDPTMVGDRTQLAVMAALDEAGYCLSVPFGENTRCDLRRGAVEFAVCSTDGHHPHPKLTRRTSEGEIDLFAVHCHENGRVYLVPIDDLPLKSQAALRVDPPRNNQIDRIRWASDYEIGTVAVGTTRTTAAA